MLGGEAAVRVSRRRALQTFAGLEVAIALWALGLPYLLNLTAPLFALAYGETGSGWFAGGRLIASLLLVSVPASLMGATLPFVVRVAGYGTPHADRRVAAVAAFNTAGAALGATAAGFLLIPALGLQRTTFAACSMSSLSALIAWWLARHESDSIVPYERPQKPRRRRTTTENVIGGGFAACIVTVGVTGFITTASEVAWTRTLALVIGPTTYAFAAILGVFIVGLALGSGLAAWVVAHVRRPGVGLSMALAITAAIPAWSMSRVERAALTFGETIAAATRLDGMVRLQAATTALVLLPLAIALGAAFTLALALAARDETRAIRRVGRLYAINTLGAVAGALGAGFVLVPAFGLQRTIVTTAIVAVAGAIATVAASSPSRGQAMAVLSACVSGLVIIWLTPTWDMELLSGGIYKYARYMEAVNVRAAARAGTLLYYGEGAATVAVRRAAGVVSLSIDGKVDASTGGDMLTQKLLAHVPLLLHPTSKRVAIIGLGSGVTLGSALTHPIERADVIEISPEVITASRYFEAQNRRALDDPRVRLIVGDGRSHFRFTQAVYDVVISEPSNPWMAGIAPLFTREFFESVRRRLAPDGVFCQWAHTYDIREPDLRSIVATFTSVFPNGSLWLVGAADLLLVASTGELAPKLADITAGFNRGNVADDLRIVAVENAGLLLEMYAGNSEELQSFAAEATVQTDDRMALEFSAPRGLVERVSTEHAVNLRRVSRNPPPIVQTTRASRTADEWAAAGRMFLEAEAYGSAYDAFATAIAARPAHERAIEGLLRAAAGAGREPDAQAMLMTAAKDDSHNVPARIGLSRIAAAKGDVETAIATVQPLMRDLPLDPRAYDQAAAVLADAGDLARLRDVAQYQQERWPERAQTAYSSATVAMFEGRLSDAYQTATAALTRFQGDARLHNTAGAAAASLRRMDDARRNFDTALALAPRDPAVYINLGLLELDSGNADAAARRFAEALLLEPDSAAAREGLSRAEGAIRR